MTDVCRPIPVEWDCVILQLRRLHHLDSPVLPQDAAQPPHLSVQVRKKKTLSSTKMFPKRSDNEEFCEGAINMIDKMISAFHPE